MQARVAFGGIAALVALAAAAYVLAAHEAAQMQPPVPNPAMPTQEGSTTTFELFIPAFIDGGPIPAAYTCDGRGESPAIEWSGVPAGAASLALIVEDPDVPKEVRSEGFFVHWVLYNIPPSAAGAPKGWPVGSVGTNGAGKAAYAPPCPPAQYEPKEHRYIFTLYALDTTLEFATVPGKEALVAAMEGHVMAQASYTGRYERP